ncbi:3-hydroxyacyl-ACP dehydratase FabZ [Ruminococcus sp. YE282]|uniref:3-hydroxyacyl-ACP dehydratase FabZ n=1 Tax=Ruminococcus sp. YE282 TaxID=3158780 RepID=UPI0008854662|nr:3-hydroxyacyl-[acyl-carrier-protein] dehydratase [Ruminococcus bromii]
MKKSNYEVNSILKQKPPFQMVDRLEELVEGKSAVGIKCVSSNEDFFLGHFPDQPIMPGVLLMESFAQTCALVMASVDGSENNEKVQMIVKVKDFKFVRVVTPGDILKVNVRRKNKSLAMATFEGEIYSGENKLVAKGEMAFSSASYNKRSE